jgi:hypothetical protein
MDPNVQDVIAAFVDGEPVTADELRAALAQDEGREYLVDLLALRGLARPASGAELAPASGTADAGVAALASSRPAPRLFWSAAAALVAISTLAGFAAGRMTGADEAPGTPTVTVQAAPPPAFGIDAPAPTRVIELKHGKDWNERSGGN